MTDRPSASGRPQTAPSLPLTLADFDLLRRVGDGSYAHVVLARLKATGQEYALKVIDKHHILRHGAVESVRRERAILDRLTYPGVVRLYFTFQDALSLYLGLEYCPNGELYDQIRMRGRLDAASAQFYAAETVLMLEALRNAGVIHRDIKPENLLLTSSGHLKLIDFGSAKECPAAGAEVERATPGLAGAAAADATASGHPDAPPASGEGQAEAAAHCADDSCTEPSQKACLNEDHGQPAGAAATCHGRAPAAASAGGGNEASRCARPTHNSLTKGRGGAGGRLVTLVGTADYVSPEVLQNEAVTHAADLWALGCVIYHMLSGRPPFKAMSEYLTFQKIVAAEYDPLPDDAPPAARDLVASLLQLEPGRRLGAADLGDLKSHPFFAGVDWEGLRDGPAPEMVLLDSESLGSAASSFDWELQSLAAALPQLPRGINSIDIDTPNPP